MGIFSDLKVVDLSRVLAGPWASQILGDLGAEVIKIEHPTLGDETRHWGPPYAGEGGEGGEGDDVSAYFTSVNRNKKSLGLDIASLEGQEIIRHLVASADVVIENFKTGGLKKYGLDYPSLAKINDRLIYCSITGFGQTGELAMRPGYDLMIQAMSGLMSITGEEGRPPVKVGVAVCDIFTGLYSAIAIISALWHRQNTGKGQHIDMALFNVSLAVLANQATNYFMSDKAPAPMGSAHPNIVPYQAFSTADGYILIAVGNDKQFKSLTELLGIPEVAADPLYSDNTARVKNRTDLITILDTELQKQATDFWQKKLTEAEVPFSPINDIKAAFNEPQAIFQNMIQQFTHAEYGTIRTPANPINFSDKSAKITYDGAPPTLGEHTDEVLKNHLNLSNDEIQNLRNKKIIA